MSLSQYFKELLERVEASDEIQNDGTDENGFYKPKRTVVLRHLRLLFDLHQKPGAKPMLRASWKAVCETLPPEWLMADETIRQELKKMLE